jgi:hypothetical protein
MKAALLVVLVIVVVGVFGFGLIQLIPYGRDHTNPPVSADAPWSSPAVRDLAVRACYDCHSNETVWPFYSNIAPVSWLVYRDVAEGREKLNFSEWDQPQEELDELSESLREGEMPPMIYYPTHPEARLTPAEKQSLAAELDRLAATGIGGGREGD